MRSIDACAVVALSGGGILALPWFPWFSPCHPDEWYAQSYHDKMKSKGIDFHPSCFNLSGVISDVNMFWNDSKQVMAFTVQVHGWMFVRTQ